MLPAPAVPESRLLRYTRRVLYGSAVVIVVCFVVLSLQSPPIKMWVDVGFSILLALAILSCLVAAIVRVGHALWATAQYAMSELLATFLAASVVSFALQKGMESRLSFTREDDMTRVLIGIWVSFGVIFSGSAWAWSALRRATGLGWNRFAVLFAGWVLAFGLGAFALFVLGMLTMLGQTWTSKDTTLAVAFLLGGVLALPGVFIERRVRRLEAQHVAPAKE